MAIGITPPSLEILKPLGLDRVFREAGVPVRHAEVFESKTQVGRLDFAGIASDYPFFLSLPQARTVEILRTNLARFPSVMLRDGFEFSGLREDGSRVCATFRESSGARVVELKSAFLVGADGHRSAVRMAAGLAVREKPYPQRFIMADFADESGLGSEARLFFAADASVESFPLPGGQRRWIVQVTDETGLAPIDYLIANVRGRTGYELSGHPARFVSTFGAKRMVVESYHAGLVLLAGDAAHVMSSIGGQGMNTGFADAEMLAEILPTVLERPDRMARCFAAYDRIRRRSFEVAAARAERGMRLGTMRGRWASWFRKHFIRDVLFSSYVDDEVDVVEQHPASGAQTLDVARAHTLLLQLFDHMLRDRANMHVRGTAHEQEVVGGVGDTAQIEHEHVETLAVRREVDGVREILRERLGWPDRFCHESAGR
jgi:2-polyprenyl-6-methoxyphenol hydroxylase-like FAD-dependent oxidoreductase